MTADEYRAHAALCGDSRLMWFGTHIMRRLNREYERLVVAGADVEPPRVGKSCEIADGRPFTSPLWRKA